MDKRNKISHEKKKICVRSENVKSRKRVWTQAGKQKGRDWKREQSYLMERGSSMGINTEREKKGKGKEVARSNDDSFR